MTKRLDDPRTCELKLHPGQGKAELFIPCGVSEKMRAQLAQAGFFTDEGQRQKDQLERLAGYDCWVMFDPELDQGLVDLLTEFCRQHQILFKQEET